MRVIAAAYLWKVASPSMSDIREIAEKWIAKNPDDPALKARIMRAIPLTQYVVEKGPNVYQVSNPESESARGGQIPVYTVVVRGNTSTCTCPDSRKGGHCKHRLAAGLVYMAKRRQTPPEL